MQDRKIKFCCINHSISRKTSRSFIFITKSRQISLFARTFKNSPEQNPIPKYLLKTCPLKRFEKTKRPSA